MATITQRHYRDDRFKVTLRHKGHPPFSLTFENRKAASDWLKKNEKKFYECPEFYLNWKLELFLKMQEKGMMVLDNIVKPKMRIL